MNSQYRTPDQTTCTPPAKNQKNMQQILALTDFSTESVSVIKYAAALASHLKQQVLLLHVKSGLHQAAAISLSSAYFAGNTAEHQKLKETGQQAQQNFRLFLQNFNDNELAHISGEYLTMNGKPAEVASKICERMGQQLSFLLVPGAAHNDPLLKIFGQDFSALMENCSLPVWVVPDGATFKPFDHLLYATSHSETDVEVLGWLTGLAEHFRAQITALHVVPDQNGSGGETVNVHHFRNLLEDRLGDDSLMIDNAAVLGNRVSHSLAGYAEMSEADVIVLYKNETSMLDRLFNNGKQLKLQKAARIPLLVFNKNVVSAHCQAD